MSEEGRHTKRARANAEQKALAQQDADLLGTGFMEYETDDGMEKWTRLNPETVLIIQAAPKARAMKAGQAARDCLSYMVSSPYHCIACGSDLEKDPEHSKSPEPVCPGKPWHDAESELHKS